MDAEICGTVSTRRFTELFALGKFFSIADNSVNRLQWGKTFPKIQFDLGEISSYFNS
jgi:hypothetical protein